MKEIIKKIRIQLKAGLATAAPPLGPLLSNHSINPSLFVKTFNEKTINLKGKLYTIIIFIFKDKTFEFKILTVPLPKLILDSLELKKGSKNSKTIIAVLKNEQLNNLIKEKKKISPHISETKLKKMILGTAKNMGISFSN